MSTALPIEDPAERKASDKVFTHVLTTLVLLGGASIILLAYNEQFGALDISAKAFLLSVVAGVFIFALVAMLAIWTQTLKSRALSRLLFALVAFLVVFSGLVAMFGPGLLVQALNAMGL